ncbi:glycosyltransferase, partial [bacterium]|nr:glycosyltransferase [bacterium]
STTWLIGSDVSVLAGQVKTALGGEKGMRGVKVFTLPAAKSYASEVSTALEAELNRTVRLAGRRLRILVVGPIYGGSLPVAHSVKRALDELGHKAELLDNSVYDNPRQHLDTITRDPNHQQQLQGMFTTLMAETVTARALAMKAQIVLFLAQAPATPDVLEELRKIGIPTAFWFVEDGSLFPYGARWSPLYDVFFHIQKGPYEEELQNAGARFTHYLPMAADPGIHRPMQLAQAERMEFGSDISHMGAGYYNRRHFFLGLLDYDFKIWGNEWDGSGALRKVLQRDGARLTTEETVKVFNATRININLHSSTYTQGVNPNGDFVNPRTFEIAAAGGFQLVDERRLLPEHFEVGRELATFRDLSTCRAAIDHYLAHPDEARSIAEAGRERVLREHTYVHRMREALEVILSRHEPAFDETPLNTVEALIEEAGDDQELAAFFSRMGEPDDELTLESITEKINREEGRIGETEAVFMMMNEFNNWAKDKGIV